MKTRTSKTILCLLLALTMIAVTACSSKGDKNVTTKAPQETTTQAESTEEKTETESEAAGGDAKAHFEGQTFAQAHDAFQTKLAQENNDDDPIPDPPAGLFDLVSYPSTVGDLAAYVSSDPGDGEKHPLIIWVVGGWGNGIDDFPFTYPEWDNDQTGSAFWQAGVLTMYPSFRGGNGNPGNYETLFGEVDDIAAAYDYAASLPYVDPDRIYLGGHSTGGTRALLAAEYTDKFRSVFCFGAVDEIKYHNRTQFTFDTSDDDEYTMRSPIYWLDDVKTPTFLIEGSEGNGDNLLRMKEATQNENIHCYIMEGADHFAPLAPLTRLLAQKILEDTGEEPSITLTQEELDTAMAQEPTVPEPVLTQINVDELGLTLSCPYIWEMTDESEDGTTALTLTSPYEGDNVWDMSTLYITSYEEEGDYLEGMTGYLKEEGYTVQEATIAGLPALDATGTAENSNGSIFNNRYILVRNGGTYVDFDFYIHEDYGTDADSLFQTVIDSISFMQ